MVSDNYLGRSAKIVDANQSSSLIPNVEDIAHCPHSVEQLDRIGIVELGPKAPDVDVDDVGIGLEIHVPRELSDHRARLNRPPCPPRARSVRLNKFLASSKIQRVYIKLCKHEKFSPIMGIIAPTSFYSPTLPWWSMDSNLSFHKA